MKVRKRHVNVDAIQWFKHGDHPAVMGYDPREGYIEDHSGTLLRVIPGDWVITESKGKCWVCSPYAFERDYEPVPDTTSLGDFREEFIRSLRRQEMANTRRGDIIALKHLAEELARQLNDLC